VIRRLALRNWRNYADLDLRLGPGTTFIVAPNGVGKTSLMEAAAWAIFGGSGQAQRPGSVVRAGASRAVASADVELPDQRVLSFTRELAKRAGPAAPGPVVRLDGVEVPAAAAADELRRLYGADLDFLARLTLPRGLAEPGNPADLGLHGHLCRLFGVDRLLSAAAELSQRVKAQDKLIREARQGTPADAGQLGALHLDVAARRHAFEQAQAAHREASELVSQARQADAARQRLGEWQEQARAYQAAIEELSRAAAPYVTLDAGHPGSVESGLEDALAARQSALQDLQLRRATLTGRAAAIEQHSATLEGAHGGCPVCRRPLDPEAASLARSAHHDELARIRAEVTSLREEESRAAQRRDQVHELARALRALPPPGPRPAGDLEASAGEPLDDLLEGQARLFTGLVSAKSALDLAEQDLARAEDGNSAHARVAELYRQDAILRASHAAISATTRELLDQTIEPLTAEVSARWQQLFPHRGPLRTASTGDVSREVNGEILPYSAFSTGERHGLVILLRLLVLEMATKANFCWFDEPLENLDPDARRRVAESLARASESGPIRQIVVTTYEEPLARRLQERHPGHVNLIYVRQGPQ